VGSAGILLMAHPSTGFKSLADLVRHARANPDKLAYGSWGNGSTGHLAMEGIKAHYGLTMPHVPFKGTSQLVTDLLANNISVAFTDIASPIPHIRAGKHRPGLHRQHPRPGPARGQHPERTGLPIRYRRLVWRLCPGQHPEPVVRRLNRRSTACWPATRWCSALPPRTCRVRRSRPRPSSPARCARTWTPGRALAKAAKLRID
jgi:hypothetical protein